MKEIKGGVTAAKGFQAASAAAEIKYKGRTDMAMIYSTVPCKAAGTFTTNVAESQMPVQERKDTDIVRRQQTRQQKSLISPRTVFLWLLQESSVCRFPLRKSKTG